MRTVIAILQCLLRLIALPISPVGYDRVTAYRMYVAPRDSWMLARERQRPGSLLCRLRRAARRQDLMNGMNLPGYIELQRKKWQRSYSYALTFRRLALCFAIGYSGDCVERVLKVGCPAAYSMWMAGCRLIITLSDTMWRHIIPDRPPWS